MEVICLTSTRTPATAPEQHLPQLTSGLSKCCGIVFFSILFCRSTQLHRSSSRHLSPLSGLPAPQRVAGFGQQGAAGRRCEGAAASRHFPPAPAGSARARAAAARARRRRRRGAVPRGPGAARGQAGGENPPCRQQRRAGGGPGTG